MKLAFISNPLHSKFILTNILKQLIFQLKPNHCILTLIFMSINSFNHPLSGWVYYTHEIIMVYQLLIYSMYNFP
jgi:hypothetical protein